MRRGKSIAQVFALVFASLIFSPTLLQAQPTPAATNATSTPVLSLDSTNEAIWQSGVGEGFRSDARSFSISAGATYGLKAFGSVEAHDFALVSLTYGHMLDHVLAEDHWYRGNFEFRLEVFGGAQFSPTSEWLVGLTPHLRYHFATGTRWIPFLDIGTGLTTTSIRHTDLGGPFQFNLQGGGGIHWFLKDDLALSIEARYLHISSAGIYRPNEGVNGLTGLLGVTFFF